MLQKTLETLKIPCRQRKLSLSLDRAASQVHSCVLMGCLLQLVNSLSASSRDVWVMHCHYCPASVFLVLA